MIADLGFPAACSTFRSPLRAFYGLRIVAWSTFALRCFDFSKPNIEAVLNTGNWPLGLRAPPAAYPHPRGGAFDCTVRNISDTGAALDVVTPLFIPERFMLVVQAEGLKRRCRIVWRKGKRMGVLFE